MPETPPTHAEQIDAELMSAADSGIDWIAEKLENSREVGRLALLSMLLSVRDAALEQASDALFLTQAKLDHQAGLVAMAVQEIANLKGELLSTEIRRSNAASAYIGAANEIDALTARLTALKAYLQHLPECDTNRCATCGHHLWMHDRTVDLNEEACQNYQAKTNCTCGLVEISAPEAEGQ